MSPPRGHNFMFARPDAGIFLKNASKETLSVGPSHKTIRSDNKLSAIEYPSSVRRAALLVAFSISTESVKRHRKTRSAEFVLKKTLECVVRKICFRQCSLRKSINLR